MGVAPGAIQPVVAGVIRARGTSFIFTYGRSYLARPDAISLYRPELPLKSGTQEPLAGLDIAGCLADAGPDSWGPLHCCASIFLKAPTCRSMGLKTANTSLRKSTLAHEKRSAGILQPSVYVI